MDNEIEIYETMRMIEACKQRRNKAKDKGEAWTRDHKDMCIHLDRFYNLIKKNLR